LVIAFGGVVLIELVLIYYPTSSIFSPNFAPRIILLVVGGVLGIFGTLLLDREKGGLDPEQRLFVRAYKATSKLKEYVMDSSKVKSRRQAKKHLRLLCLRLEKQWTLNFKLAKETLGPVATFVTDMRDKVLYSVEKGSHEHASNALAFVEAFAWFLLKEHPTTRDLPDVGSLVLLERPQEKETRISRVVTWIRRQPGSKSITMYSVVGVIVGVLAFGIARSVGADVNYAWAGAVAVFLAFFGYSWKKT